MTLALAPTYSITLTRAEFDLTFVRAVALRALSIVAGRAVGDRYEQLGAFVASRLANSDDVAATLDELDLELDADIRELVQLVLRPRTFFASRVALKLIRNSDIVGAWKQFGPIVATRVRLGWIYLREFERLINIPRLALAVPEIPTASELRDHFVYNQDMPPEVSRLIVQSRRATPALFALLYLLEHPRALSSSVQHGLAEQFEAAAHASLQCLALDGLPVDPEVISVEPVTLQELQERHQRRVELFMSRLEAGELAEPGEPEAEAR